MCIGIPGEIIEIKGKKAKIRQKDHFHWVDTSCLCEKIKKGDFLITYQETAVNKISPKEAKEVLKLMNCTGDTRVKGSN